MKQFGKQQQLRTPHPACRKNCRHKRKFEKRNDPEHPDGLMIKNFAMDWQKENYMGKEYFGETDTTGHNPNATKTESENSCYRSRLKSDGNRSGRTDGLRCLPHFSSCCFFGSLGPFRFAAQNLRIPVISNSVNLYQQQPVFDSFFRFFCVWCNSTLSSTVCKCTPCQQRKSHQLQQTFFRGFSECHCRCHCRCLLLHVNDVCRKMTSHRAVSIRS